MRNLEIFITIQKKKNQTINPFLVKTIINEYSVFIADIYLPWEHPGTALYLRENPEIHAYHIKHVSKALKFAFFNIYLPNQENKYMFVAFACVTASQMLKVIGWVLQCCDDFSTFWLENLRLPCLLKLSDPNSHSVLIFV